MFSLILHASSPTGWRLGPVQSHLQEETTRRRQLQGVKKPRHQWRRRPWHRANQLAAAATPHGHYPSTAPGRHEHHRRRRNRAGALLLQLQQHCQQQQQCCSSAMLPAHGNWQPWHELPGPCPAWPWRRIWSSELRQEVAQGRAEPVWRWGGAKPATWVGCCYCNLQLDESLLGKLIQQSTSDWWFHMN